jgi:malate dehydrogenase (oxaloacetate-decarboxylating)
VCDCHSNQLLIGCFLLVSPSATVGFYNLATVNKLTSFSDALIYPGLGLGAILSKSRTISDEMIIAGARRLASLSPALADPDNALLPDFADSPAVNLEVAIAVAEQAISEGSAGVDWKKEEVRAKAKEKQWEP